MNALLVNYQVGFEVVKNKFQLAKLEGVLFTFLILGAMPGCGGDEPIAVEKTIVQTFGEDPESLGRGQALFLGSCAGECHKFEDLEGASDNLFDCYWYNGESDEELFNVVTVGLPGTKMLGFGTNFPEGDNDLWKIIAFIKYTQEPCK
mgnify:FL=1